MNRLCAIAIVACLSVAVSPVYAAQEPDSAQEQLVLDHFGDWVVDYADTHCRLLRGLGNGEKKVVAQFVAYQPGESFDILAVGEPLEMDEAAAITIAFGNQRVATDVEPTLGIVGDNRTPVIFLGNHSLHLQQETDVKIDSGDMSVDEMNQITSISIAYPDGRSFMLNTGPLGQPIMALRACVDDLYRSWGIDPTTLAEVETPPDPKTRPETWVTTQDYPVAMLRQDKGSNVEFLLIVDAQGKIESCHIQTVTDDKSFGDLVCRLVQQRARFNPALNLEGEPTRSIYQNSIQFRIP